MSLHAFVSLPPCRLFIISASSFCLRLGSPALSHAFSLPLPLFPRIFAFVFPASFSSSLSHAFLLVLPSIFFALFPAASLSSLRLPPFCRPPPASFLSAFPRLLLAASTSTPVSSPLRFPSPSGNSSLLRLGAFSLTGILFVLFQVRGFVEVRALLLRQAGGGCLPLLGIKSIYIGVNAIFCEKCIFSMKKSGNACRFKKSPYLCIRI